ncbi:MAG TPA: class I SAM-dependent methyltransferase [Terriglobales bacterium]|nr:class I SAM-dependent methyltransferase [Terriglobales bacterium]HVN30822.1 class I SAM-dependent methyltransferase [Thermoanaerobaculaceae bacterium]
MIWALINDLGQRAVTLNKWEQRRRLRGRLKALALPPGSKVLDFGCGTGLFANTFSESGLTYRGYDIDDRLVSFARRTHSGHVFASTRDEVARHGPFDLIVANCCFHHIPDDALAEELGWVKAILADRGTFLLIDIVARPEDRSILRRAFRAMERGAFLRREEEYVAIVGGHLAVRRVSAEQSNVLSIPNNPVHNNLVVIECGK